MNREDALEIWLPIIKMGVKSMPECSEAVDMAIKALEQEPCEDVISRQAVIDAIEEVCPIYKNDYRYILKDKIEQLPPVKPEPCEDAISRQAVLNLAKFDGRDGLGSIIHAFDVEQLPPVTPQYTDAEIQKMQDLEFAEIQKAYEIGKEEGSSEKPNKWIPVSERLPEFIINNTVSEDVLVFDGVDIRVGEYRKGNCLNGAEYWRVYGYEDEYVDVIAWMPLPEPYKVEPQESENKKGGTQHDD